MEVNTACSQRASSSRQKNECGILYNRGYTREVVPREGGREVMGPQLPAYLVRTDSSVEED